MWLLRRFPEQCGVLSAGCRCAHGSCRELPLGLRLIFNSVLEAGFRDDNVPVGFPKGSYRGHDCSFDCFNLGHSLKILYV